MDSLQHKINYIDIKQLIPYARNSRTHDENQIGQIAASIKEFGFLSPCLIDEENGIICGHGRVLAAQKLNIDTIPCIEVKHLTPTQKKAYIIADNQLTLNSDWNIDLLKIEIEDLQGLDFDIDLLGFDDDFMGDLLFEETEGLTDEDAVPDIPEEPITKQGDIWVLGNHRVMCGDSTMIDDVEKLMDGNKADMVFTDPPYGMSYGGGRAAGSTKKGALVKAHGMIKGDDLKDESLVQMISDSIDNSIILAKKGAAAYVCFTWRSYSEFYNALERISIAPNACIVWDKKSIGLGQSNYRPQHEFIFYCGGQWYGGKGQSDVWYMSRGSTGEYVHPTQKPVELIEKALNNSSKQDDSIHDCFGGSGSTLIACEKTNRNCYMMELDPKYCDVIIKRWEQYTGNTAVLLETNRFSEAING